MDARSLEIATGGGRIQQRQSQLASVVHNEDRPTGERQTGGADLVAVQHIEADGQLAGGIVDNRVRKRLVGGQLLYAMEEGKLHSTVLGSHYRRYLLPYSRMSTIQSRCEAALSHDNAIGLTPRCRNSGISLATRVSSVVQTGVKSAGCENRIAHLLIMSVHMVNIG